MPIYEYACEKCQQDFEAEQRITDDPLKTCPNCKSRKIKRLISQTSFVLKGSGWYSDLYSSSKGKPDAKSTDASSSSDSSSSESEKKSEKKSEKSSEKKSSKNKGKAA